MSLHPTCHEREPLGPLGASRCCPLLPQQLFLQIAWKLTLIGSSRHCVHTEVLVASFALCRVCVFILHTEHDSPLCTERPGVQIHLWTCLSIGLSEHLLMKSKSPGLFG